MTSAAVPFFAGVVAAVFAATVWHRARTRPHAHAVAWSLGLTAYALASFVEALVAVNGWTPLLYRAYFPVASVLVGLLGLGTVYLARTPRVGHAFAALVAVGALVAALGQFTVPLTAGTVVGPEGAAKPLAAWGPDLGAAVVPFPHPARVAFLLLNVAGGLALIGGALTSWWRDRRAGVLLIGVGALLPFMGGSLSTLGVPDARVVAQLAGIAVMFAGYAASTFRTAPHLAGGTRPTTRE